MELRYLFKKAAFVNHSTSKENGEDINKPSAPEGMLCKCAKCSAAVFTEEVSKNYYVCPECEAYFRMDARTRIKSITEEDSFVEWDTDLSIKNPLGTPGYEAKLQGLMEKTGLDEAVITGIGKIGKNETVLCVCDCRFMMASMGSNVGEKITRAVERATERKLPVIIFACSGGARMQEGIVSLMQMAKTSAALKRHSDAGQLYISVLTDPTTGGVTASFAMLGDIILAEPGALIGFAGPRVIEQTIGQKLPEGFQRSEFLLEHGFVDAIVSRKEMKSTLDLLLTFHSADKSTLGSKVVADIAKNASKANANTVSSNSKAKKRKNSKLSAWDKVCISRQKNRPVADDYISAMFDDFCEMHGDRYFKDDKAIIGGIAHIGGQAVTVIAEAKGKNTTDNIKRNFGMPSPDGYRKALRLMKQAEKFNRPIILFVDTPGAFCGLEAEERGQGEAIATNLYEMSTLKVPILSIVIGEGGSGGALALAVADQVWMLENAIYAILSPEGYASILWKDAKRANEAASEMKLTANDLLSLGIIDRIIDEPETMNEESLEGVATNLKEQILSFLSNSNSLLGENIANKRYERFRRM